METLVPFNSLEAFLKDLLMYGQLQGIQRSPLKSFAFAAALFYQTHDFQEEILLSGIPTHHPDLYRTLDQFFAYFYNHFGFREYNRGTFERYYKKGDEMYYLTFTYFPERSSELKISFRKT